MKKRMTAAQLANLKPFQKGDNPNPIGGNAHDPVAKAVKRLTSQEVQELISLVTKADIKDLTRIMKDPTSTVLKVWIASIALHGLKKGDVGAMDKLLERMIGKVRQEVAVGDPQGNALPASEVHLHLPSNGREAKS